MVAAAPVALDPGARGLGRATSRHDDHAAAVDALERRGDRPRGAEGVDRRRGSASRRRSSTMTNATDRELCRTAARAPCATSAAERPPDPQQRELVDRRVARAWRRAGPARNRTRSSSRSKRAKPSRTRLQVGVEAGDAVRRSAARCWLGLPESPEAVGDPHPPVGELVRVEVGPHEDGPAAAAGAALDEVAGDAPRRGPRRGTAPGGRGAAAPSRCTGGTTLAASSSGPAGTGALPRETVVRVAGRTRTGSRSWLTLIGRRPTRGGRSACSKPDLVSRGSARRAARAFTTRGSAALQRVRAPASRW